MRILFPSELPHLSCYATYVLSESVDRRPWFLVVHGRRIVVDLFIVAVERRRAKSVRSALKRSARRRKQLRTASCFEDDAIGFDEKGFIQSLRCWSKSSARETERGEKKDRRAITVLPYYAVVVDTSSPTSTVGGRPFCTTTNFH